MVIVWPMARLAGEFVHVGRPAGGFDGRYGHGVNFARVVLPFFRGRVFDVTLTESANFGGDGFLLLQEHAAGFEIADLGNHCTLHYSAAFVVFDVAHPPRFFEGDIFCKSLLLEVPNGIIIGIG